MRSYERCVEVSVAIMIPENTSEFQTPGEEQFFRFLAHVARPDSQFIAWYLPDIAGHELDFLLFNKDVGLIIFEVKDWALNQIENASKKEFSLNIGGTIEKRKNPFSQAREYLFFLIEKLKEEESFLSSDPMYMGKLTIPVSTGAVLTNINKDDFFAQHLDQVIDPDKTLFNDDISPYSPYRNDPSGESFRVKLTKMFPPLFPFKISNKKINRLRNLIFPIVVIDLPCRSGSNAFNQHKNMLAVLDHHQESIVRTLNGCQLILGPAGSGKTLALVHQAASLFAKKTIETKILFVCYNVSLVHFIKRLLAAKGVSLGVQGVDVVQYNEVCGRIIGEKISHEGEKSEYFDLITQLALESVSSSDLRYDAIFIDEGQDFSPEMARVVIGLLSQSFHIISVAFDESQCIYGKSCDWTSLSTKQWQVHNLRHIYRNSHEIAKLARHIINEPAAKELTKNDAVFLPENFGHHGPAPMAILGNSGEEILKYIGDEILRLQKIEEIPYSEIAVLYISRKSPYCSGEEFPDKIKEALEIKGILADWMSEDYRSKKSYDITTEKVCISTVHSAKGLDYDTVIVVGLESLFDHRWNIDVQKRLIYVALTRARRRVCFAMLNSTKLLDLEFNKKLSCDYLFEICN